MSVEAVRLGLLVFIAVLLVCGFVAAFWYMRYLTRLIIGEVRAAGLVRATLDDEFGPPPVVSAAVQGGRHRGLHLVGSGRGPVARFVLGRLFAAS